MASRMTSSRTPSSRSSGATSGSCWVLTRTVWTRRGRRSASYSTVTWLLPSGRRNEQPALAADLGQLAAHLVGELDRHRHQLGGLVRGVAEHHPLVAGAELVRVDPLLRLERVVDAKRDVGRLLLERGDRAAGLIVEAEPRVVVADLADGVAHDRLHVAVGLGRHLAEDEDEAGGGRHLDRHAGLRVAREDVVEDGVGDLVAELVGVALGHGLRGEEGVAVRDGHCGAECTVGGGAAPTFPCSGRCG